jgi:hypothetical protein
VNAAMNMMSNPTATIISTRVNPVLLFLRMYHSPL